MSHFVFPKHSTFSDKDGYGRELSGTNPPINLDLCSNFGKDRSDYKNAEYLIRFHLVSRDCLTWSFNNKKDRDEEYQLLVEAIKNERR